MTERVTRHEIPPGSEVDDPQAFEAAALERIGLSNPWVAFREFRGRDAELAPLLERRGLVA